MVGGIKASQNVATKTSTSSLSSEPSNIQLFICLFHLIFDNFLFIQSRCLIGRATNTANNSISLLYFSIGVFFIYFQKWKPENSFWFAACEIFVHVKLKIKLVKCPQMVCMNFFNFLFYFETNNWNTLRQCFDITHTFNALTEIVHHDQATSPFVSFIFISYIKHTDQKDTRPHATHVRHEESDSEMWWLSFAHRDWITSFRYCVKLFVYPFCCDVLISSFSFDWLLSVSV